jgi:hypothetical protein
VAGLTATCNPGGVGKWLPAYSELLRGKCVYIVPDNDKTGHKHAKCSIAWRALFSGCAGLSCRANNGRPVKDISDLRETCDTTEAFLDALSALEERSRLIERGIDSRFQRWRNWRRDMSRD